MKNHSLFIGCLAAAGFMTLTSCESMDDDHRHAPPTTTTTTTEETTTSRNPLSPFPATSTTETTTVRSY